MRHDQMIGFDRDLSHCSRPRPSPLPLVAMEASGCQRDLFVRRFLNPLLDGLEVLHLPAQARDLACAWSWPQRCRCPPVGPPGLSIACDVTSTCMRLATGEVLVAVVDRFELGGSHDRLSEQIDELGAHRPDRRAVSRRKLAMDSGARRPVSHISSMLRWDSRSRAARLDPIEVAVERRSSRGSKGDRRPTGRRGPDALKAQRAQIHSSMKITTRTGARSRNRQFRQQQRLTSVSALDETPHGRPS